MNTPTALNGLDWLVMVALLALTIGIGISFRKKAGRSLQHFFLGGRNLPWYIAGTSMVATTFAADTPLAVTELVAQNGIAGNWLWWNMLAGGMLTVFFFARYWQRAGVLTDLELITLRYGGAPARFLRGFRAVYFGLFMNVMIIGWVNVAFMSLLEVFFDLGRTDQILVTGLAMLLVAGYSAMSGLLGVAFTDVVQFVLAMAGCIVLAVLVLYSPDIGGIAGLTAKLPAGALDFFPSIGSSTAGNGEAGGAGNTLVLSIGAFFAFVGVQWWASWYPGNEPGGGGYVAQRLMSTPNEKQAVYATLWFNIAHYCLRPWPWIIVALCATVLYPQLAAQGNEKLGYVMAMKQYLPAGLKGLLLAAFFAAYMSTISTQLNWGSSYLVHDLYARLQRNTPTQGQLVAAGRVVTFISMAVALAVTTAISSISGVWSFIIECGAGLGLVLILRWYWWRINAWSEITATIAPFVFYAIAHWGLGWQHPNSYFLTVGGTTLVWVLATFLTKPEPAPLLQAFYQRIQPAGAWGPVKKALGASPQAASAGPAAGTAQGSSSLGFTLLAWLSAVSMAYSLLFATGKLIFGQYGAAGGYAAAALLAFVILRLAAGRARLFA